MWICVSGLTNQVCPETPGIGADIAGRVGLVGIVVQIGRTVESVFYEVCNA